MLGFLTQLFDTSGFPARWHCGNWTELHGWLHILSDLGVWSAYVAIPCVLGYFVIRRRDIPFRMIFLLFGAFILACGTTHLMEAIIFWWPAYRLAGAIKLCTALVSWGTVAALVKVAPLALAVRTPEELQREIDARKLVEEALKEANEQLDNQLQVLRRSEEKFRLLVDGTRDHAIFMLDAKGRVVSWNRGAERIKQFSAEEIIGRNSSIFYTAEDNQSGKPEREMVTAVAEGRYEDEGWRLRKDGTRFWANIVLTALKDDEGNLLGFSKITRDMTERKQSEENARRLLEEEAARHAAESLADRVREEQERLRVTLQSIGDGVIATDTQGHVTFLNPAAEALTGWSELEGACGKPLETVFKILDEQSRQPVDNPVARALQERRSVDLSRDTVLVARNGTERHIADCASPIWDRNAEITGVVLVFRDVSDQRRAREVDRRNQEIRQLVYQIGKIGHWEWNSDSDESRWSPENEALHGLPVGGFKGSFREWARLVHPEDLPKAEGELRQALAKGELYSEFRVIWPDGSIHWLETRARVFKNAHEQPVRIVGVNMDITRRKQQEQALRASELRWRNLAETLPNLVWSTWPNGEADWLSSQWRNYTGIPEKELLGNGWLKTVHVDDRERTSAAWKAAWKDRVKYDVEYRVLRHDGEARWFKTRGVPVCDESDNILYWIGTCTDIEDVKRLEAALWEADRRKNEFLATLAHELRNPLAPLRTGLQLLRLAQDRPAQEQTLQMMQRQLGQMVRLIDDLLDISRITHNKLELRKAVIPLESIVENAVETARPLIDSKGQTLTVNLPPEPIELHADLTRLSQVFWNLLHNSAKYTESGGQIELTARRHGDELEVIVRDNGIGIPPEAISDLFTLFSQVDRGQERRVERSQGGLGIGLALVKGLVEMHGGHIWAHSDGNGKGSEFVVRLPIDRSNDNAETLSGAPLGRTELNKRRVLIVDDNRDGAASLGMMLSIAGHDTRIAHDGLGAIELAEVFRPEVILMDIGLPKLNGYDTCRRIRQEPWGKGISIVAVTGWGQEDDRLRSLAAGFDHHLVKPVDLESITQLLAGLRHTNRPTN